MINTQKITAIDIDQQKCVGCCGCELRCPEVFVVGDCLDGPEQGKSQLRPDAAEHFASSRERIEFAAAKCLMKAITIHYDTI